MEDVLCKKCKTPATGGGVIIEGGVDYPFCKHCMIILEAHPTMMRVHRFLKDELDLSEESKAMIEARKRRSEGRSPWRRSKLTNF